MKITKQEIRKIIREEIKKEINQTTSSGETVSEDTFHDEESHDDEDVDHLENIRREMNRHIDMLKKQHDRAEGRHEYREDD
jgi:hypothetical protein